MFYKLSNTLEIENLEVALDATFKFNNLYQKEVLIDGLKEQSIIVIKDDNPKQIDYAIWGILPQKFKEDWKDFQNINNTLNIDIDSVENDAWLLEAYEKRRCLVVVNGLFTSYMHEGKLYPYYVSYQDKSPIVLAGIYNILEDGFITASILTKSFDKEQFCCHNINSHFPIVLSKDMQKEWLDRNRIIHKKSFIDQLDYNGLEAYTIAREFYKNNIVFDALLEPATYRELPTLNYKL